jgi:low affinity Fe/Cu permease
MQRPLRRNGRAVCSFPSRFVGQYEGIDMTLPTFNKRSHPWLEQFSQQATRATGSTAAFVLAVLTVVVWVATGPVFGFSDTWQLVINTGTTIVTFLMVFLIQRTQNKDALATQLKLNEILAALKGRATGSSTWKT